MPLTTDRTVLYIIVLLGGGLSGADLSLTQVTSIYNWVVKLEGGGLFFISDS